MARRVGAGIGISIGNVGRGSGVQAVAGGGHGGGQGGDVGVDVRAGIGSSGSGIGISGRGGGRQADGGALGGKVDADGADAIHRAQRLGNMVDTGGAGHTGDGKGQGLGLGAAGRPAGGGVIRWLCHHSASGGLCWRAGQPPAVRAGCPPAPGWPAPPGCWRSRPVAGTSAGARMPASAPSPGARGCPATGWRCGQSRRGGRPGRSS